jgi:hypothetical protein
MWCLPPGFPTTILYTFIISMCITWPAHPISPLIGYSNTLSGPMNPVHILAPYFFSTIFPSTSTFPKWSLSMGFSDYIFISISSPPFPPNDSV